MVTTGELEALLRVTMKFLDYTATLMAILLTAIVNEIALWVLEQKKKALTAISAWLQNTNPIIALSVTFIVAGILIVGVAVVQYLVEKKVQLSTIIASIQNLSDLAKVEIYWNMLKAAWAVVTTLDERFGKLNQMFQDTMHVINDTFGLPLGFLSGLMNAYKVYVTALYAMIGLPPTDAKIDFLTNISDWLARADREFRQYAMRPGRLVDLLLGLALQADPETAATLNRDLIAGVAGLNTTVSDLQENFALVRGSFDDFIESFPEELREQVTEALQPFLTFVDEKITPIIERIDNIATELRPIILALIALGTREISADVQAVTRWVNKFKSLLHFNIETTDNREAILSTVLTNGIIPSYIEGMQLDVLYAAAQKWRMEHTAPPAPVLIPSTQIFGMHYLSDLTIPNISAWYVPILDQSSGTGAPWLLVEG